MHRRYVFTLIVALLLVIVGVLLAQDDQGNVNDPGFNPRANACYTGGSLAGKCHTTDADRNGVIDERDIEYMWTCGWYLIRVEFKQLPPSAAPTGCNIVFPTPIPPALVLPRATAAVPTVTPSPEPTDDDDCNQDDCDRPPLDQ